MLSRQTCENTIFPPMSVDTISKLGVFHVSSVPNVCTRMLWTIPYSSFSSTDLSKTSSLSSFVIFKRMFCKKDFAKKKKKFVSKTIQEIFWKTRKKEKETTSKTATKYQSKCEILGIIFRCCLAVMWGNVMEWGGVRWLAEKWKPENLWNLREKFFHLFWI